MFLSSIPLVLMIGSPMQMLVIGLIILILFGASRLGDVGKGLGEGIRNFKKGMAGDGEDDERSNRPSKRIAAPNSETTAEAAPSNKTEGEGRG